MVVRQNQPQSWRDDGVPGRESAASIAQTLFTELQARGIALSRVEWLRKQVTFLEQHRFYTASSIQEREPVKQQHLQSLRAQLAIAF